MKKFEYKKYTKLDIIHFGNIYFDKNEQIKSQKSASFINEDVFFDGQTFRRKTSDDELFDKATRQYRRN